MGAPTRTRTLESRLYVTDGHKLLYVLNLPEGGQAVVEDASTGSVECIPARRLEGWRVVKPEKVADGA